MALALSLKTGGTARSEGVRRRHCSGAQALALRRSSGLGRAGAAAVLGHLGYPAMRGGSPWDARKSFSRCLIQWCSIRMGHRCSTGRTPSVAKFQILGLKWGHAMFGHRAHALHDPPAMQKTPRKNMRAPVPNQPHHVGLVQVRVRAS